MESFDSSLILAGKTKDSLRKTLRVVMLYFWFGLIWYLIGPRDFQQTSTKALFWLIFYVSAYFIAFYLGYTVKLRRIYKVEPKPSVKGKVLSYLQIMIWVNLLFTFLNALQYTYTTSLSQLFNNFLTALSDPGEAYFSKILSMQEISTSYSILTYITVFLGPLLFPTLVMSVYYFKDLRRLQKAAVVATLMLEAFRWIALGTNKGLLDIAVLFFFVLVCKALRPKEESTHRDKKRSRQYIILAAIVIVIFIVVFSYFLVSRNDDYPMDMFQSFPYNLVPEGLRPALHKLTSYLCQGYRSMQHILANLDWEFTYGVGNSVFLLNVFYRITGIDLSVLTYQHRIIETGLVANGAFQSVFSYFANDITFPGVILLMFFAGGYFCTILKESIMDEDPVSMTLTYMMFLALLNVSCLNYMLSYSNMCVGFWGLFFVRLIKKKYRIRFI